MMTQDFSLSKTLNPPLSIHSLSSFLPFSHRIYKTLHPKPKIPKISPIKSSLTNPDPQFSRQNAHFCRDIRPFAGRSKKNRGGGGGGSGGRIEGNAEFRRKVKEGARARSKKVADTMFYKMKNSSKNYADNFTEEELEMIGLGYDRMVRFMDKDDPRLRHPYDWYKYGEYGPYSWRGVVVGEPIRGRFTDECVTLMSEVRNVEEWEKIDQHEMNLDFQKRMSQLDRNVGFRYYWVFVRHPRWRLNELPWEQWTLVSEVVLEAGQERLDKWNLMGRLGNKARSCIARCASWFRPDVTYVKKPVFQCRFEPQDDFFRALTPFLDPSTEEDYPCNLKHEDGIVETCTYFGGLCKILKVNPKSFVDDVVKAYDRLSDEKKSKCLEFLLTNHPVLLLHPYTKEWKAKLEEMELGCDAPDDDEDSGSANSGNNEIVEWIEDDGDDDDDDVGDDEILDMGDGGDNGVMDKEEDEDDDTEAEDQEEDSAPEEDVKYWDEEFKKAVRSSEAMEKLAKRSVEMSNAMYEKHMGSMEGKEMRDVTEDGDELALRGKWPKVSPEEWKIAGYGPWRKRTKKSKIPPELFLRAAVRPFTYRNLVKEIVLTRHAILDGEIGSKAGVKQ